VHLSGNCEGTAASHSIHRQKEVREDRDNGAIDIHQLAKLLKNKCAAGGTVKGRIIELQGDHKKKAAQVLRANGYNVEVR
jgi:translation initiation factor 1